MLGTQTHFEGIMFSHHFCSIVAKHEQAKALELRSLSRSCFCLWESRPSLNSHMPKTQPPDRARMKRSSLLVMLFALLAGCASGHRKTEAEIASASVKALCPVDLSETERARTPACNFP
jgi:hypothetical protein